ncbi:hypothetical protein KW797_03050 [Candidatus Parcubacteria bacterium]|nr:hypothetical protein [Candidatus Parcubacteria bacterium]
MPQPTVATSTVFSKANKVVKIEVLPIPNVPADFMLNHNTEVLLEMMRDLWTKLGPALVSGFAISFASGQWTITAGRLLVDGYDITFGSSFVFSPLGSDQEVVLRVTETQLSFETDPSIVGFTPPGSLVQQKGMNQYRYSGVLVHKLVSASTPSPVAPQSKIKDFRLFRIAADGITLTEKSTVLPTPLYQQLQYLIEQISVFLPATISTKGVSRLSGTPSSVPEPVSATLDANGDAMAAGITRQNSILGSGAVEVGARAADTTVAVGHSASSGTSVEAASGAGPSGQALLVKNHTDANISSATVAFRVQQKFGGVFKDILKIAGSGALIIFKNLFTAVPAADTAQIELTTNGLATPNTRYRVFVRWPNGKVSNIVQSDKF